MVWFEGLWFACLVFLHLRNTKKDANQTCIPEIREVLRYKLEGRGFGTMFTEPSIITRCSGKDLEKYQASWIKIIHISYCSSLQLATVHIWDHSGAQGLRITVQNPKIRRQWLYEEKEKMLTSLHISTIYHKTNLMYKLSCWSHGWQRFWNTLMHKGW